VEAARKFAADLLQTEEVSALKEADRRLATELVMGVLRWGGELDFQVEQISGKPVKRLDPEVATILRMGVYQIQFLERIPKAAAVNEAVELTKAAHKRSATGFVNVVLRRCPLGNRTLRSEQFNGLDEAARASVQRATPAWLLARWEALEPAALPVKARGQLSPDGCNEQLTTDDGQRTTDEAVALRLAWASTRVPPTVLRVVDPAQDIPRLREELAGQGIETTPGRFSPRALVVESGNVQASQALREGRVVLQDEASQLIVELLSPDAGQRVLDLCAAPGIKAGQIAQMLGSGTLVTCDLGASRLHTMARLLPRWLPNGIQWMAVRMDACQTLPFGCRFERILLDAPCSGTGTLARNPEIKWRLRPEDLQRLAEAQVKMLKNALGSLGPGGRLVYATCSMEPEENEGVVESVLEELPAYHRVPASVLKDAFPAFTPLFDSQGYLRTRPDLYRMDGFFAAVIEGKSQHS
jgi:16S rRNA (cytosine967-C5)-methyltransferase